MKSALMRVKRAIRPLIPDRIMARYRLHQHSRQVRTNVDVLLSNRADMRRWLRATPDTYRVGMVGETSRRTTRAEAVTLGDDSKWSFAVDLLVDADAVIVAEVMPPRLVGRRRVEPTARAVAIALSPAVAADLAVSSGDDPVTVHQRLADAGYRIRLVPRIVRAVDAKRYDPIDRPAVIMLAAVPMHDVGGGSRTTQLALEFLRRGFHVIYVSLFGTQESKDLGIRYVHSHLEQYRREEFDAAVTARRCAQRGLALLEVPALSLETIWASLGVAGFTTGYDIIDRWSDPALGDDWYVADVERRICRAANVVLASASDLVDHAASFGVAAALVPNAVNAAVFGRDPGPVPGDFPTGSGPVIGYHGSLYGDWFSWADVEEVAEQFPSARVVIIGDIPRTVPQLPSNVALLGLKAQEQLPGYVHRFDVGLVPFIVSATTHAVSPLKVFEYLACGVPVAAPPLRSLQGIAGVMVAERLVDAVTTALREPRPDPAATLRLHSWEARVAQILTLAEIRSQTKSGGARTEVRPVIHYSRNERRMGAPPRRDR